MREECLRCAKCHGLVEPGEKCEAYAQSPALCVVCLEAYVRAILARSKYDNNNR